MVTLETDTNAGNVLRVVIMTQPAYSAKQDPFACAKKVITAMVEPSHIAANAPTRQLLQERPVRLGVLLIQLVNAKRAITETGIIATRATRRAASFQPHQEPRVLREARLTQLFAPAKMDTTATACSAHLALCAMQMRMPQAHA